jgi:hypothetical protein
VTDREQHYSGQVGPSGAAKFRDVRVQKDMQSAVNQWYSQDTANAGGPQRLALIRTDSH